VSFPKWVYDEIPKLESEFLKTIWREKIKVDILSINWKLIISKV
jgi:hypothetical protein